MSAIASAEEAQALQKSLAVLLEGVNRIESLLERYLEHAGPAPGRRRAVAVREARLVEYGRFIFRWRWPIIAIWVLLLVAWLPLGVEVDSFPVALLSAVVIGLLGPGWLSLDHAAGIEITCWAGGGIALGVGVLATAALLAVFWRPRAPGCTDTGACELQCRAK